MEIAILMNLLRGLQLRINFARGPRNEFGTFIVLKPTLVQSLTAISIKVALPKHGRRKLFLVGGGGGC